MRGVRSLTTSPPLFTAIFIHSVARPAANPPLCSDVQLRWAPLRRPTLLTASVVRAAEVEDRCDLRLSITQLQKVPVVPNARRSSFRDRTYSIAASPCQTTSFHCAFALRVENILNTRGADSITQLLFRPSRHYPTRLLSTPTAFSFLTESEVHGCAGAAQG